MLFLGTYSRGHCLAKLKTGLLLAIIEEEIETLSVKNKTKTPKRARRQQNDLYIALFSLAFPCRKDLCEKN